MSSEPATPLLPGSDAAYRYGFKPIKKLVHTLWDLKIEGLENIPATGPAILTPNHLSFCDSVFVPAALDRRVWAIGKAEYMDDWKTKHIFSAFGMIPVDRSGGKAAQVALDTAASVLDSGNLFLIYPEGTRSRSGNLHKGRTGPARLSARCNAPIIPVGHIGTVDIQPPDYPIMRPFKKCTIRFGKPMYVTDHGDAADPRSRRLFIDEVMFQIAKLSEQTYVDTYANAPAKETAESTEAPKVTIPKPPNRGATVVAPTIEQQTTITLPPGRARVDSNS